MWVKTATTILPSTHQRRGEACKFMHIGVWMHTLKWGCTHSGVDAHTSGVPHPFTHRLTGHLRVNLFPDGAITSISVFGEILPCVYPPPSRPRSAGASRDINFASAKLGAWVIYASCNRIGSRHLCMDNKPACLYEVWDTPRQTLRPPIIFTNARGQPKISDSGEHSVIVKFGQRCKRV